jgi:hypothetical protein
MRLCVRAGQRVAGLARCPDHPGPWQDSRGHLRRYLRDLEPLNEGRHKKDRITYGSQWVHAKRHYDLAGATAYWRSQMHKELMKALGDNERRAYWIAANKCQLVRRIPRPWDVQFKTVDMSGWGQQPHMAPVLSASA